MADTGKKVEVRYGAFACTIEGYDNPAEQLEAILGKMQKMIAETPQFSQVSSGSEAQDLQEALDPDKQDEAPSPGIVIIRDSDASAEKSDHQAQPDASITDAEEVTDPAPEEASDPEDATAFAEDASAQDAKSDADDSPETAGEETQNAGDSDLTGFAARAAALATGAAGVSAFASDDDAADAEDAQTEVERDADLAESDDPWTVAEPEATDPSNEPQASVSAEHEVEIEGDDTPESISASDVESTSEADAALAEIDKQPKVGEDVSETDASDPVNIFAEPADAAEELERSEPDATPEPQDTSDTNENIFAEPAEAASEPAVNIFAEPTDAVTAEPVNIFAEARDTQEAVPTTEPADRAPAEADVNIFAAAEVETEAPAPAEAEPNIFADPDPQPQAEAEKDVNIFAEPDLAVETSADPFAEREDVSESEVNIFSDSQPNEAAASEGPAIDSPVNIFAAPEEAVAATASSAKETFEDAVNIFADPVSNVANDVRERAHNVADAGADMWNSAAETLEQATPETVRETLDDLGARVSGLTAASDGTAERSNTDQAFSIFADVPDTDAPHQMAQEPEADDPGQITNNRFQTLLGRGPAGPVMGAPGEPDAAAISKPETGTILGADIASAGDLARRAGSDSVSDLLAASAAWLTFAEGKSRFSRREVMDIFETIPGDHSKTLEARIKGYGKLVRSGMLVLVDDGVFAMAQSERDRFQTTLDRS